MSALNDCKQVSIDTISWTPLGPTVVCSALSILNTDTNPVKLRTRAADPTSERTLPAQTERVYVAGAQARFQPPNLFCYAQATVGTPVIVVESVW